MRAEAFIQPQESMGESIMRFLRGLDLEGKTDELIDLVLEKIPMPRWVPKWVIRRVLDKLLPEKIFDLVEILLQKAGQLPSDRQTHPTNPGF